MSTGMESVSTANKAFESIHQSVSEVGQRIKNVAGSVAEMTSQSKQIVESILSFSEGAVTAYCVNRESKSIVY